MSIPNPAPTPAAFSQTYPTNHESRLPTVGPSRQTQRGRSISSSSDTPRPDTPRGLLPVGATPQEAAQKADAAFQVEHGDFDHTSRSAEQWYPHSRAIEDASPGNDGAPPGVREAGSQFNNWSLSCEGDATLDAEPGEFRGSYSDLLSHFDHTSQPAEQWSSPSRAIGDASLGNDGAHPGVRELGSQLESQSNDCCSSHEEDATLDAEPGIFRGSYCDLLSQPWADAEPGIFRGSYNDLLSQPWPASSFAEDSFAYDPETSLDPSHNDSHTDGVFDDEPSLFEQESAVETFYNTSVSSNADLDMWQHPYAPPSSSTEPSQSVDIGLSQPTPTTAAGADPQLKPVNENSAATLQPQTERAPRGKRTKPLSPKTGQRALHNRRNQLVCVTCRKRKTACIRRNGDNQPCAWCDKEGLLCQRWKSSAPRDGSEDSKWIAGYPGSAT